MRLLTCALLISIGCVAHVSAEAGKLCSRDEAIAAEGEASTLKDWTSVYNSFRRYSQCDDAGIGEGYSESIVRLLTEGWNSINELGNLASKDKRFEKFVLHHVDELMSPEQAQKIYKNVRSNCPLTTKRLCRLIESKLDDMTSHIHICPPYGKATCVPGQEAR